MSDLKPCPFCGGKAYMFDTSGVFPFTQFRVICNNSCCMQSGFSDTREEAAEKWNRRAPDVDTPCDAWKVFWTNFKKEGKR